MNDDIDMIRFERDTALDRVRELERQLKDALSVSVVAQRNLLELSTANAVRELQR